MKDVLTPSAKNVLIPLGLTAAASVTDPAIQKGIFGWEIITLIFSNEDLNYIIKVIKLLEDFGSLIKGVTETLKKGGFLGMLQATLGASLLENILAGNGVIRAAEGAIRAEKYVLRSLETQKCDEAETTFKCVYSRNNYLKQGMGYMS